MRPPIKLLLVAAAIACWVASDFVIASAVAEPPPWAPAHGYRAKHKTKHKRKHAHERQYHETVAFTVPAIGIDISNCNREILGGVLGGAVGGVLGAQVGKGDGNTAATIAGAVIGTIVGGAIGRSMDQLDQACVGQVLEQAQTGQTVTWHDPDRGARYAVTPTRTYERGDRQYCREYMAEAVIGDQPAEVYGTACRQADGSWRLID